jgi:hypothetical protein
VGRSPVLVIIDAVAIVVNAIIFRIRSGQYAPNRASEPAWLAFDIAEAGP